MGILCDVLLTLYLSQYADCLDTAWAVPKIQRTDTKPFGKLIPKKRLDAQPFSVFKDNSLMNCVTECIVRRHCHSFSYSKKSLRCELHDFKNDTILVDKFEWVYSRIKTWPKVRI